MSFSNEYASPDLLTDRRFGAGTEFPHVYVNATPGGRLPASDKATEFADALVITTANPPLLDVSAGSRLRRRPTRMFERRPGQIRSWDSPQNDLLFNWASQKRVQRGVGLQAPGKVRIWDLVPPQFNPPFPHRVISPRRDVRGLTRKQRVLNFVSPQFNPPFPFRAVKQNRSPRGLLGRKAKPIETPPTQAAPAVNPDFSWGRPQPRTMRGLLRRKSKPVEIVPAQIVLVQSDVPWSRTQARALRGLLQRKNGARGTLFIFPGAAPVVAGTGVYLERDAIRIIPLVTSDGGATWRPRGT